MCVVCGTGREAGERWEKSGCLRRLCRLPSLSLNTECPMCDLHTVSPDTVAR
jgi:hypothetical protein